MPNANRLFAALLPATQVRLRPHVDLVHLSKGRVLCEAGDAARYAFFPLDGMVSLLAVSEEGHAFEVAMVGTAGFVGVPIALNDHPSPYQVMVQIPCAAYRVNAEAFLREFRRGEDLHAIALDYIQALMRQLVQSAVCHRLHSLAQRLCRWLLMSRDCVHSNTIELTQESIAHLLGLSRPKVSQALVILEESQLIHQGHGRIHIVDVEGLGRWSCECYLAVQDRAGESPLRRAR